MDAELKELFLKELELNKESLLRICSVYAPDAEMKNDFFQESVFNIWKSLPSFRAKSSMRTWMYRVTVNVCLGLGKREKKIKLESIEFIEERIVLDQNDDKKPKLERLRKCISELELTNKTIVGLYLEELTYKEISNITGLTENHVAVKMKRIRTKLLKCITNSDE